MPLSCIQNDPRSIFNCFSFWDHFYMNHPREWTCASSCSWLSMARCLSMNSTETARRERLWALCTKDRSNKLWRLIWPRPADSEALHPWLQDGEKPKNKKCIWAIISIPSWALRQEARLWEHLKMYLPKQYNGPRAKFPGPNMHFWSFWAKYWSFLAQLAPCPTKKTKQTRCLSSFYRTQVRS